MNYKENYDATNLFAKIKPCLEIIVSDESILGNCLIVFTNEGKITSFIEELDSNYDNYGIIVIELMSDSTGVVSYVDGELANLFDVNSNVNIVE